MAEKAKKKNNAKGREVKVSTLLYSILIILGVAIVALGVLIYAFGWDNNLTRKAEKIIPYPAVVINKTNIISLADLSDNLNSVKKFYENQDFSKADMRIDFSTDNGKKRLKIKEREILNRMIEDKTIEILAKQRGITISDKMINDSLDQKLKEYGSGENLKDNLGRLYGWTIENFKNKIVKPDLYSQELEKAFNSQNPSIADAKLQIEKAEADLNKNKDFAIVAKEYSKGSTAQDGGELGWFKKDQLIPAISEAVFSLDKGKRSDILESPLGFHIVEVEDKKTENGDDLVKIRQIFVPTKTFAEYLTEEMKKMKFLVLIPGYSWNQDKAEAEFKSEDMKNFEKELINNSQGDASVLF
jgi:parvulin-like peptidyl-prolyl isomerase